MKSPALAKFYYIFKIRKRKIMSNTLVPKILEVLLTKLSYQKLTLEGKNLGILPLS